ncbi:Ser-Thr-rich glycosyl-phosphatidyl-inositol-anchored membrane family-domain-containing protein [Rhexocercosporidium sp. MPI-PUGE-AT-0058]|nr:Ser-Thr-rich glycosyl-phosphatidyl-inositol-anchored membrane family-domain-containing protein [Rhexocercosporidium sp. MPI-PUGE-AT-0058]
MQFSTTLILAAVAALASAQNPFTFTTLTSITAGTPFNITWAPSTGTTDTVSLVLRQGESTSLDTVQTIASKIQNTGSYLWTPPTSLVNGPNYAFQIIDDGNTAIVNYSNQFSISSTNTVTSARSSTASSASASASASSGASTTSGSSAASTTGTSSGSATSGSSKTSASGTATSSSSASGTQSAASTPTSNSNGAGSLKVGCGLLAVLGAVMALL